MTVGDRIKYRRNELNISQVDLAEKVKISKQRLYKYENNIVTNIPSDVLEVIAYHLEVSPAYLMGWDSVLQEADTDEVIEFLTDISFYEHIKKLRSLSKERRQTIYDTIDFWFEKEGRN